MIDIDFKRFKFLVALLHVYKERSLKNMAVTTNQLSNWMGCSSSHIIQMKPWLIKEKVLLVDGSTFTKSRRVADTFKVNKPAIAKKVFSEWNTYPLHELAHDYLDREDIDEELKDVLKSLKT